MSEVGSNSIMTGMFAEVPGTSPCAATNSKRLDRSKSGVTRAELITAALGVGGHSLEAF